MKMTRILIATRNRHKVAEIQDILGAPFLMHDLADFPEAPVTIEDAPDFAGNAVKKATDLARWLQRQSPELDYIIADDSGLEVDALNGAPGVHSARFAALDSGKNGNSSDAENNAKLLRLLSGIPQARRKARFKCVIALVPVLGGEIENASPVCYAQPIDFLTQTFEGTCEGEILEMAQGKNGFGYDPLFVPEGFHKSFGELSEIEKNRISHRSKAVQKLKEFLAMSER